MFLMAHTGITLAAAKGLEMQNGDRFSGKIDYRFILTGSLLPDIIDKPLGGLLLPEILGSGRIYSHTLAFLLLLLAAGLIFKGRARRCLLALAGGSAVHLFLDGMWRSPDTFLWPLYGWGFPGGNPDNWMHMWMQTLANDPSVLGPEIAGAVCLLFFLAAVSHSGIRRFILTGQF